MEPQAVNTDVRRGFKRILLCVDPTAASSRTAAFVPHLASQGTHVRIVGVVENARAVIPLGPLGGFHLSTAHALLLQDVENACAASRALFASSGAEVEVQIIDLITRGGGVVQALAKAAQDWQADLLVMGSRQHQGLLHWVEGALSAPFLSCPSVATLRGAAGRSESCSQSTAVQRHGRGCALEQGLHRRGPIYARSMSSTGQPA